VLQIFETADPMWRIEWIVQVEGRRSRAKYLYLFVGVDCAPRVAPRRPSADSTYSHTPDLTTRARLSARHRLKPFHRLYPCRQPLPFNYSQAVTYLLLVIAPFRTAYNNVLVFPLRARDDIGTSITKTTQPSSGARCARYHAHTI